jgi:hypothetical protein
MPIESPSMTGLSTKVRAAVEPHTRNRAAADGQQPGGHRKPVRALAKLLLILLVIPLLIVMATRNPQGMAHFVELVFMLGAKLLNATATFLDTLLDGHSRGA